jgi:hypothetical protein
MKIVGNSVGVNEGETVFVVVIKFVAANDGGRLVSRDGTLLCIPFDGDCEGIEVNIVGRSIVVGWIDGKSDSKSVGCLVSSKPCVGEIVS